MDIISVHITFKLQIGLRYCALACHQAHGRNNIVQHNKTEYPSCTTTPAMFQMCDVIKGMNNTLKGVMLDGLYYLIPPLIVR